VWCWKGNKYSLKFYKAFGWDWKNRIVLYPQTFPMQTLCPTRYQRNNYRSLMFSRWWQCAKVVGNYRKTIRCSTGLRRQNVRCISIPKVWSCNKQTAAFLSLDHKDVRHYFPSNMGRLWSACFPCNLQIHSKWHCRKGSVHNFCLRTRYVTAFV